MEAASSSKILVPVCEWLGVTSQKAIIFTLIKGMETLYTWEMCVCFIVYMGFWAKEGEHSGQMNDVKCKQNFHWKTWMEEATWETYM